LALETLLAVAVVLLALWAWSLHSDNQNLKKQVNALNNNPLLVEQRAQQKLLNDVSKLIELPKNETPVMRKVSDAATLRKQAAFFNDAQNGDEVLFFVNNSLVVVYRPSTNKIVKSGPLTVNNTQTSSTSTTTKH
jgi:hypothetical protein